MASVNILSIEIWVINDHYSWYKKRDFFVIQWKHCLGLTKHFNSQNEIKFQSYIGLSPDVGGSFISDFPLLQHALEQFGQGVIIGWYASD